MADREQNDKERLEAALSLLNAPTIFAAEKGRDIMTGSGMAAQDSLIAEVDRTILRRVLQFANAKGDSMALDIAERRILRFSTPGSTWKVASVEDATSVQTLAEAAVRFCEGSESLHVVSRLPADTASSTPLGVSPDLLRTDNGDAKSSSFESRAYVDAVLEHALACVHAEGSSVIEAWGSDDLVERIKLCLAQGVIPSRPILLWMNRSSSGLCFGCAHGDDQSVWVGAHRDRAKAVIDAWGDLPAGAA